MLVMFNVRSEAKKRVFDSELRVAVASGSAAIGNLGP